MGYPSPIGGITRSINPFTWIHTTQFKLFDRVNIGARMALINIPNTKNLIIWSSIPISDELTNAIQKATNDKPEEYSIVAAIVPNTLHTVAACGLKKAYPNLKLIGPYGITDKPDLKLDYEFQKEDANKIVKGTEISPELTNVDFVFLEGHKNHDIITLDTNTKSLYVADVIFNLHGDGCEKDQEVLKQGGLYGYFTSAVNPNSIVGRYFSRKLFPPTDQNKQVISTILNDLDFDSIVCCHGKIIETDAKEALKKIYGEYKL